MNINWLMNSFFGFSIITAVAQVVPTDPMSAVSQVEHMGAIGMLITGCIVLWRAREGSTERHRADIKEKDLIIERKDAAILDMSKAQTAAVVSMTESNRELRQQLAKGQDDLIEEVRAARAASISLKG